MGEMGPFSQSISVPGCEHAARRDERLRSLRGRWRPRSRSVLRTERPHLALDRYFFSPTHPFLPYVAPHFSHISHFNLVFLCSTDTWLTIAHELGHNFGGRHTFEEGGRMSYTRDTPFVPVPNDICAGITAAIEETPECMQFEQAACGNGQLESGEECDDGNEVSDDGCSADCTVECRHVSLSHPEVAGSDP